MGEATKGVLVHFPLAMLAELDAAAKRRSVARVAIILERCGDGERVTLPDALLARVDAWAKANGLSRDVAILALIERGLGSAGQAAPGAPSRPPAERAREVTPPQDPGPRAILRDAEEGAAHLGASAMKAAGVPLGNTRGPLQKRKPVGAR